MYYHVIYEETRQPSLNSNIIIKLLIQRVWFSRCIPNKESVYYLLRLSSEEIIIKFIFGQIQVQGNLNWIKMWIFVHSVDFLEICV